MKAIKLFRYSGNKENFCNTFNNIVANLPDYIVSYIEPFVGSGAIFLNLNRKFDSYIINDKDYNIVSMFNAVNFFSYEQYLKSIEYVKNKFGDIKESKEAYYNFRNSWNKSFYNSKDTKRGLFLLQLASACINSMFRFGPNGMNQSYGNRSYIIPEESYNIIKEKLNYTTITNLDYKNLGLDKLSNSLLFLDPPYETREMTYNKNFDLSEFLKYIELINHNNNIIIYTDMENTKSDILLTKGWYKFKIRDMVSTSPNRKSGIEKTGQEVFYTNYDFKLR